MFDHDFSFSILEDLLLDNLFNDFLLLDNLCNFLDLFNLYSDNSLLDFSLLNYDFLFNFILLNSFNCHFLDDFLGHNSILGHCHNFHFFSDHWVLNDPVNVHYFLDWVVNVVYLFNDSLFVLFNDLFNWFLNDSVHVHGFVGVLWLFNVSGDIFVNNDVFLLDAADLYEFGNGLLSILVNLHLNHFLFSNNVNLFNLDSFLLFDDICVLNIHEHFLDLNFNLGLFNNIDHLFFNDDFLDLKNFLDGTDLVFNDVCLLLGDSVYFGYIEGFSDNFLNVGHFLFDDNLWFKIALGTFSGGRSLLNSSSNELFLGLDLTTFLLVAVLQCFHISNIWNHFTKISHLNNNSINLWVN